MAQTTVENRKPCSPQGAPFGAGSLQWFPWFVDHDPARLAGVLSGPLAEHLTWFEIEALRHWIRDVLVRGVFPEDPTGMRFPWQLV